jgi:glutamate/tyrosine decarboxylase-like PLP-dependent enzyme
MRLARQGRSREALMETLRETMRGDAPWNEGKTFLLVYGVDDDHLRVLQDAHALYIQTNGLGAGSMFPSLAKLEGEVVGIAAELLGRPEAVGNITSGGTESILMGIRCARERARAERPQIRRPQMILPVSAHPAFQKAAAMFDIEIVPVPLDGDYRADLAAVKRAITDDTIVMVGSAPNYPYGTIDPIAEMAGMAAARGIHFHADCSVGGFALPFLRKLGEAVPPFDFAVPGVDTISSDIHKYGFGERGTSLILYRDAALQERARFVLDAWSGGPYRTPTIAGSRPGAIVASAWAIIHYFGEEGYLRLNREMLATTRALQAGIERIPGFRVIGKPAMYVFGFASDRHDIWAVGEAMAERGWSLHRQPTEPRSLHLVITPIHTAIVDRFLADLAASADAVAREGRSARLASNYANH